VTPRAMCSSCASSSTEAAPGAALLSWP
jgi:hypothetical protein